MPEPLSPAAQAIDRAIADRIQLLGEIAPSRQIAAAALEALADQVTPEGGCEAPACCLSVAESIRRDILQIAAELRGGQADG